MKTMEDPLVRKVEQLLEDSSVPELVEALVVIAKHYKAELKKERNSEWQGWALIEDELAKVLKAIE